MQKKQKKQKQNGAPGVGLVSAKIQVLSHGDPHQLVRNQTMPRSFQLPDFFYYYFVYFLFLVLLVMEKHRLPGQASANATEERSIL